MFDNHHYKPSSYRWTRDKWSAYTWGGQTLRGLRLQEVLCLWRTLTNQRIDRLKKEINGESSKKLTAAKTSGRDGHIPMIKYNAVSTVLYLKDKKQMTSKIIIPMNSTESILTAGNGFPILVVLRQRVGARGKFKRRILLVIILQWLALHTYVPSLPSDYQTYQTNQFVIFLWILH